MSNAERRVKNEEVGICVLTQMALLKLLGTLYFACLPQAGTLYNEVLLLDTSYLILFLISNAELRLMNEEVGICVPTQMAVRRYLVPCTLYFVQPSTIFFPLTFFFYPNKLQFCSKSSWNGCITSTPETFTSR